MLQFIRNFAGSWVVKILFVLLILSFGIWGIGDVFRSTTPTTVAEVGKERDRIILEGTIPSATKLIPGCPFATRCPRKLGAICDNEPPPQHVTPQGHRIACHIPLDDLAKLNTRAAE